MCLLYVLYAAWKHYFPFSKKSMESVSVIFGGSEIGLENYLLYTRQIAH